MTAARVVLVAAAALALAACGKGERKSEGAFKDASPHRVGTAEVNGARLTYLDWGGQGPGLLLLHGMGDSPHTFDDLAPALTDGFHVVGLSRRGHGQSERRWDYDVNTLVEDIRQFLDTLGWRQAVLVGHDMAGSEMVRFAALYPERVSKLVFLDAAVDYHGDAFIAAVSHFPGASAPPPPAGAYLEVFRAWFKEANWPGIAWSPAMEAEVRDVAALRADATVDFLMDDTAIAGALQTGLVSYHKEYAKVRAPALAIVAGVYPGALLPPNAPEPTQRAVEQWIVRYAQPYADSNLARLRRELPGVRVVYMPETNHYVYLQRPAAVIAAIRDFLGEPPR